MEAVADGGRRARETGVYPVGEFVLGKVEHDGVGLLRCHVVGDDEPLFLCLAAVCRRLLERGITIGSAGQSSDALIFLLAVRIGGALAGPELGELYEPGC